MVHQKYVVGKIEFVIRIAEQVRLAGRQFLELVDKIVADCAEQSARHAERLTCQLK